MHERLAFVSLVVGVPGVVALIAAMVAIIVLALLYLIIELFHSWFGRIPVLGPIIGPYINQAAQAMRDGSMAIWHGLLWALTHFVHMVAAVLRDLGEGITTLTDELVNAVEHQSYVVIPREISNTRRWASSLISKSLMTSLAYGRYVLHQAYQLHAAANAYTNRQLSALAVRLRAAAQADSRHVTAYVRQVQAADQVAIAAVRQLAHQLHAADQAASQAGDKLAIQTALKDAQVWTDSQAQTAAATIWAGIDTEIRGLETALGTDLADVGRMLRQVPTGTPETLMAALASGMAIIPPVLRLQADCTVPTCRDLGGIRQLSHLLGESATMAALLAWMIYCITDPAAAAADTVDISGPIAAATMDPLLHLLQVI